MYKHISIKNHQQEIKLITQRAMVGFIIMCLFVLLLVVRLAYLQIHKNEMYTTLSTKNWLDLVPVEPTRGLIFDRNGVTLAENIPVFSLDIVPFQVPNLTKTLTALSRLVNLQDSDIILFKRQLKQHRRFDEIPLKLRLSEEEVARFMENQHRFPGVMVKARLMRHYPFGPSFSHVLGYVGRINAEELSTIDPINYSASHYIGKLGIEKSYESELHGTVGYEQVENNASGKPIRVLKKIHGKSGKNVYLTIDSGLQFVIEKAMGNHRGAVIAIQPKTGQLLAMVSAPSYDPNPFVLGISRKDYRVLQTSTDRPLYNRALRGLYSPASTIKPYLAVEALNEGITTTDYTIMDDGWFQLRPNSRRFHDSRQRGHGMVDLNRALVTSCNIYYYELASRMGIQKISHVLTKFGFGANTGIDLEDVQGLVPTPEWKEAAKGMSWYEGDTLLSGIGHGYLQATPLQLAVATATLANRGQHYLPYLLLADQVPGQPLNIHTPTPLEQLILKDDKIWDFVLNAMQEVITSKDGTGKRFGKGYTYTVAGKTGTSQSSKRRNPDEMDKQENLPEKLRDHHLFISFAPIENPQIALAIVTENSNVAVETARIILDYYLGNKSNANQHPKSEVQKTPA